LLAAGITRQNVFQPLQDLFCFALAKGCEYELFLCKHNEEAESAKVMIHIFAIKYAKRYAAMMEQRNFFMLLLF